MYLLLGIAHPGKQGPGGEAVHFPLQLAAELLADLLPDLGFSHVGARIMGQDNLVITPIVDCLDNLY